MRESLTLGCISGHQNPDAASLQPGMPYRERGRHGTRAFIAIDSLCLDSYRNLAHFLRRAIVHKANDWIIKAIPRGRGSL